MEESTQFFDLHGDFTQNTNKYNLVNQKKERLCIVDGAAFSPKVIKFVPSHPTVPNHPILQYQFFH